MPSEFAQENVRERELHIGWDAAITPVLDTLGAAVDVVPKQTRDLGRSAEAHDDFPVVVVNFIRIHE